MKVLLHLPHVSLRLPKKFYKGLLIDKINLNKYNLTMSDLGIDFLFQDFKTYKIKPKYSRLFCDVEKFKDDNKEVMSKYGQGVIYTHTFDNVKFHQHNQKYRNKVYRYYDRYHRRLDRLVDRLLKKDEDLLILDCHSFSDKLAKQFCGGEYPDICIGVENGYYDQEILGKIIAKIEDSGYTYAINYPYVGSIIPNAFLNGKVKGKVITIMLEINKRIYL